jgi:hypothetical protein
MMMMMVVIMVVMVVVIILVKRQRNVRPLVCFSAQNALAQLFPIKLKPFCLFTCNFFFCPDITNDFSYQHAAFSFIGMVKMAVKPF